MNVLLFSGAVTSRNVEMTAQYKENFSLVYLLVNFVSMLG
jgi:hypothetical protein